MADREPGRSSWAAPDQEPLESLGFTWRGERFEKGPLRYSRRQGWAVLERPARGESNDPLDGWLGQPGPWRAIGGSASPKYVVDLPPELLRPEYARGAAPNDCAALQSALRWALQAGEGGDFDGWEAPDREEVERWVNRSGFTFQNANHVRQGQLVRERRRLALRIPLLDSLSPDLGPTRRAWLREVLIDAGNRCRMVRVGLEGSTVQVEVDLTGAPAPICPLLVRAGLGALRWCLQATLESAVFLAESNVSCSILEARHSPRKREKELVKK